MIDIHCECCHCKDLREKEARRSRMNYLKYLRDSGDPKLAEELKKGGHES